jgi:hypothetical protein
MYWYPSILPFCVIRLDSQPIPQGTTYCGRGNGGRFQSGRGNGGGCNDAYHNDSASNVSQSTAVSTSSTLTNHVPAVAPAYRWTSPDVNGRVPTYQPNPARADNHWIDSVGATEDE